MKNKRVTIADIATKLNVSLHTVNKALHGKKGVSEATRQKILDTARAMNYQVNRVAQSMARNPMIIGVVSSSARWQHIHEDFMAGVEKGIDHLRDYNVSGCYYSFKQEKLRLQTICQAISDKVSVIVCIHFVPDDSEVELMKQAGIPFALLGTDGQWKNRLISIRANSLVEGRLVADMIAMTLSSDASVIAFTGKMSYLDHADKIDGFRQAMTLYGFQEPQVYEHNDDPEEAIEVTTAALAEHRQIDAVYISTANGTAICDVLAKSGSKPLVIATDLYDDLRERIKDRSVAATIFQNATEQGEKIVQLLYSTICEHQKIDSEVFITPTVILPANIDFF